MIKRYDYEPDGMHEHEYGNYIEYSDYESAQARIEQLEEIISYLPKIPTEPYEKRMAQKIVELETNFKKLTRKLELEQSDMKQVLQACEKIEKQNEIMKAALREVTVKSHCWIITQNTGHIEKPIHDSYRYIAREALSKVEGMK